MLSFSERVSLLPYNTFHIDVNARYFTVIKSAADVPDLVGSDLFRENPGIILGGGSNILFTRPFDGLVIKNELGGIETVDEDEQSISLRVGSGENWHGLVMHCVNRDLGGIENLSLIPGTTGAAPMQNIGAYGVEVKNVVRSVEAIDLRSGECKVFQNEACKFGYRESYFKHEGKGRYFISSVTLTLTKKNHHFNTSYGAIRETLQMMKADKPTVRSISDAVIHIRRSKLPDPQVVGNAGSFFKNPTITASGYDELRKNFPDCPGYPEPEQKVKVPAGWMIEQCGWKGKTFSSIGVHPNQALVLVNYGGGSGEEIAELARKIQLSVKEKFNITLHPEVNIM